MDKPKKKKRIYCTWCKAEIEGEEIYIRTRRGTEMHICPKCWRQRWRALLLVIKAKFEAIESGVSCFDDEFLAHIVLPDGAA